MNALGMIEVQSIPLGVNAGDAMLKAATVQLVSAQPVCAGKYIVIVTGEVSAVSESVAAGKAEAGQRLIDSMVISHVHEQVPRAINACNEIGEVAAIGVMEAYSLCAAVVAADAAVNLFLPHVEDLRIHAAFFQFPLNLFQRGIRAALLVGASVQKHHFHSGFPPFHRCLLPLQRRGAYI